VKGGSSGLTEVVSGGQKLLSSLLLSPHAICPVTYAVVRSALLGDAAAGGGGWRRVAAGSDGCAAAGRGDGVGVD